MTSVQWMLTIAAWLVGLGAVAFAYVVQLANAMKSTAPPLSVRDAGIAIAPSILCAGLLALEYLVARRAGNIGRALIWNIPSLCGAGLAVLMVVAGWASSRPAARRAATARMRAAEERRNADLWQSSAWLSEYELRVERGIQKVFTTSDGKQRAGVDWRITFKADGRPAAVTVHSFPSTDDAIDLSHHARAVLQQLKHQLDSGWRPSASDEECLEIVVAS
jgi:hypothetical protein